MHCVGMCGPLVLAIPTQAQSRWKFIVERIMYNSGRALAYGFLGALLGLFGNQLFLAGIQQNLSIVLGLSILLTVIIPLGLKSRLQKFSPMAKLYSVVKTKFAMLIQKRGMVALIAMGILNGFLPCGLVYTALVGATAVADVWKSALFMMVFGVGTLPALVAVAMAGKLISLKFRSLFTRAVPALSLTLAVILILRGMNLGIPLVSPKVSHTATQTQTETHTKMDCCE